MARERDEPSGAGAEPEPGVATRLLWRSRGADAEGQRELAALLFGELHGLASRAMAREGEGHTLQPTALLGEVWLRLFAADSPQPADRQHFLAVASKVMRQVLVDHSRARRRIKRAGAWRRVALDDLDRAGELGVAPGEVDLVDLDLALEELRAAAPRPAEVVELRFFGGLEVDEVADVLGMSASTVAREWRFARAWLMNRLGEG